jgi:hypothetical protein
MTDPRVMTEREVDRAGQLEVITEPEVMTKREAMTDFVARAVGRRRLARFCVVFP